VIRGRSTVGAKREKGSKVHAAVDTLGHLLALYVTPRMCRIGIGSPRRPRPCRRRPGTRSSWRMSSGDTPAPTRRRPLPTRGRPGGGEASRGEAGFVLPPRRLMVERSFGWAARFRGLAKDYERLTEHRVWDNWPFFLIFTTLLMLEWWLRKRHG
jgi:transposase